MRTLRLLATVCLAIALFGATAAFANPGDVDQSFSDDLDSGDTSASAIAPAPRGGFVVAGESSGAFSVTKLDHDGSAIRRFGGDGSAGATVGDEDSARATSVLALANGKVIVAGSTLVKVGADFERRAALVRFTSSGRLDPAFGDKGRLVLSFGSSDSAAYGMVAGPQGRLLITGYDDVDKDEVIFTSKARMIVAQLTSAGRLDRSFGRRGIAKLAPTGYAAVGYELFRLRNGRIVVGGYARRGGRNRIVAARLRASGALDRTFGTSGFAAPALASGSFGESTIQDMALTRTGRIVIAGAATNDDEDTQTLMLRLTASGKRDNSFGRRGIVRLAGAFDSAADAVAVQRDGKIILAGDVESDYGVRRYTARGARDLAYGVRGLAFADGGENSDDFTTDALLQSDGRVIVIGTTMTEEDRLDFSEQFQTTVRFEGGTLLVRIGSGPVRASARTVPVRVQCRSEARRRCTGTLRLRSVTELRLRKGGRAAYRTLGSTRFVIPRGATTTLHVPLTALGRRLASGKRNLTTRAIAQVRDAAGSKGATRRVFEIRPSA